jgi:dihydroorotate dehydrogenase
MFRLPEDRAVINRLGFNNQGQAEAWLRLRECRHGSGIIGVNIGANKDSEDRIADYVAGVQTMSPVAKYLTINISSPNTPGLRQLQDEGALRALLSAISDARERSGPPVFLKVAPDLGEGEPDQIVRAAIQHGIDAIIVANTTVSRPALRSKHRDQQGGLSGAPLRALALKALRDFRSASGGQIPLIGVGGIASADDAWERIRAGANLVQLYTAMVYDGPGIARRMAAGLAARLKREGIANISEIVGADA